MKTKKINFTILLMIVISLATQVLSLAKSSILAEAFGIGSDMDAFNLANNIAVFIFDFIAVGISTIIIPEYANKRNNKAVDTFITIIYGTVLALIFLIVALRKPVISLLGGSCETVIATTEYILIVLLFAKYIQSVSNVTVAYFQCEGKYNLPKIFVLISNAAVIVSLLLIEKIEIVQYTLIFAGGLLLNFFMDFLAARKMGWTYRPTLKINEEAEQLLRRFFPIVISTGVYRMSLLIDTIIASSLGTGKLSVISYSTQIAGIVDTVIVGNLVTYLYPKIAKRIEEKGYQHQFWMDTSTLHAIVCLISAGFFTVGYEGIALLFQRGAFHEDATRMVFIGTGIYLVGYQPRTIRALLSRYFYACKNTKIPSMTSIVENITNIVVSLSLVRIIGFYGIIIGTVISSMVALGLTLFFFKKEFGFDENPKNVIGRYIISVLIGLFSVLLVYMTKRLFVISNDLLSFSIFGAETVVIYLVFSMLLNKKTLLNLKKL